MLRVHPETIKRSIRAGKTRAVWAGWGWRIPHREAERLLEQGLDCPARRNQRREVRP